MDGTDHSKYLWGNAAYCAGRAHDQLVRACTAWCAAIRGVEGGGLVEGLPIHNFYTDEGDVAMKCPTEVPITDRREKELADLGFVPLVHCKGTDYAAFFSVQSCQKPKLYDKDSANANARLSTQLAVHHGGFPLRALSEGHDARQDRQLHVARGSRDLPESLDHQLRDAGRHRVAGNQSAASACAKRASTSRKFPASRACIVRLLSCGRTSSWTSLPFRFGWWPTCRRRQSNLRFLLHWAECSAAHSLHAVELKSREGE